MQTTDKLAQMAEDFQKQCHKHIEFMLSDYERKGITNIPLHQDLTNTWLFLKLAEL